MNVRAGGFALMWRLLAVLCAVAVPGCDRGRQVAPDQYGIVRMELGGQPFTLELAATEKTRQHGLMHRQSMPANHGMLFVFADEQPLSFWMKNTLIPLDIVYLDKGGKVVSVSRMKPMDETGVPSGRPAKYAIELNEGTAARVGLKVGDVLNVPPAARESLDPR